MLLEDYYATIGDLTSATLEDLHATNNYDGRTPLMSAVLHGDLDIIRMLRKFGAVTEHRDKNGHTALLKAVKRGNLKTLDDLLDDSISTILEVSAESEAQPMGLSGVDENDKNEQSKAAPVIKKKVTRPDVNAGGGTQPTALHEAARNGQMDVVRSLIKHGARIDAQGEQYNTALSAASVGEWDKIVRYLLNECQEKEVVVNLLGGEGGFANSLGAALYSLKLHLLPPLLTSKANVNAIDTQGRSSFHIAAARGSWKVITQLRQTEGYEVPKKDKQGRILLHHAAMSGDAHLIEKLIMDTELALSVTERDVDGWTPLHWACRQDNANVIEVLWDRQTGPRSIEEDTKGGWTCKNIAIAHSMSYNTVADLKPRMNPERYPPEKGRLWGFSHHRHLDVTCAGCFIHPSIGTYSVALSKLPRL
ncbi:ankyrin [Camillea tinctor]|nr:ankyrin [Camillea tinctor]